MRNPGYTYLDRMAAKAFKAHEDCNHRYAGDLPYSFHLKMAAAVADQFKHLLSGKMIHFTVDPDSINAKDGLKLSDQELAKTAVYFHDAIEDARMTYNDVAAIIGQSAADIVYAVTNEKGKTRAERANDKYYQGIRETPLATYVKLCDRIANVRFGQMTGSRMVQMYQKENPDFVQKLGYAEDHELAEMFNYLNDMFK